MPATLNESPSEKEGKYGGRFAAAASATPSMKVPPKRKGNLDTSAAPFGALAPQ